MRVLVQSLWGPLILLVYRLCDIVHTIFFNHLLNMLSFSSCVSVSLKMIFVFLSIFFKSKAKYEGRKRFYSVDVSMICVQMLVQCHLPGRSEATKITIKTSNYFTLKHFIIFILSNILFCFFIVEILTLFFSVTTFVGFVIPPYSSVTVFTPSLFTIFS